MDSSAIYSVLLKQGIPFVAGLASTALVGLSVGPLIRKTRKRWDEPAPTGITEEEWLKAVKLPESYHEPIRLLGHLERIGFFIALWMGPGYAIAIAGWLAFKVASKWETYQNIVKFPEKLPGVPELEMYGVRLRFGSNIFLRFLLGTLANVLCGALGVGVGKGVQLIMS